MSVNAEHDEVMARLVDLLAHQLKAPVDLGTRLRVFLQGASLNFHSKMLPWFDSVIDLDEIYTQQYVIRKMTDGTIQTQDLGTLFNKNRHLLILGEPGAGKTTALCALGLHLIEECQNTEIATRFAILAQFEPISPTIIFPILIVAVTKIEVQAILKVFSTDAQRVRQTIGNKIYYALGVHGGAPVFMVQSEMGTATPGGALSTVSQAIQDLHPQAVILCGCAYGLRPDKQKPGDILIAKQIGDYESQIGDRATTSEHLLDLFRSADLDWNGPPTHFGLVLSGEKVADAPTFRDGLLKNEPEAIGGEMEGTGLYTAARKAKVDWILVKAICDWADGKKDDGAQILAANNAAQFVLHALQLGKWNEKIPAGHNTTDHPNERSGQLPIESLTAGQIPVYVPLGEYKELERPKPGVIPNRLLAFVLRFMPALDRPDQEKLLESGQVALLLDGLDEITDPLLRSQVICEIQSLATCHLGQACHIIVTSRSAPYEKSQEKLRVPFQVWRLTPLDIVEQNELAKRMLKVLAGPAGGEKLYADLVVQMKNRPGLESTLQVPLLLTMLVIVFADTGQIKPPGTRYEYFVDRLLLRRKGIHQSSLNNLEPAQQRSLAADKARLGYLAYRCLETGGRLAQPDVAPKSQSQGSQEEELDTFLRRMETEAGLIKFSLGPNEGLLAFTPHATFHDFFVGYHLSQDWHKNSREVRQFIEDNIASPIWEMSIRFCLSLIGIDGTAWPIVQRVMARTPRIAAKLLRNGLEMTYAELPPKNRVIISWCLRRRAWELLNPQIGIPRLERRFFDPEREESYINALNQRREAIQAIGDLQISEFGPLMVQAALQVPWLKTEFKDSMIQMGPKGLWPELSAWLDVYDDFFYHWARQVIIHWQGPESLDIYHKLIEQNTWPAIGLEGLARQATPEALTLFRKAAEHPELAEDALILGIQYYLEGLEDAGLAWLAQNPTDTYRLGRNLACYLAQLPLAQGVAGMRKLIDFDRDSQRIRDLFESQKAESILPLLRIFIELFKEHDPELNEVLDLAIYQMFKCQKIDPRDGDVPEIFENVLLYGNRNVRQFLCKKFQLYPLSDAACAEFLAQMDVTAPDPTWLESVELLEFAPPIKEPWRARFVDKLRPGLQYKDRRYYITVLLAHLGEHDAELVEFLAQSANREGGEPFALDALVSLGSREAFPAILRGLMGRGGIYDPVQAVADLGRIWNNLSPAQCRQGLELLRKQLDEGNWFTKMQAVDVLGRLHMRDEAQKILDLVAHGNLDPEKVVCGRALGQMGWKTELERWLWTAFRRGNEHLCGTVIYAWRMSGVAQAGRYLVRALGSVVTITQATDVGHRPDLAQQYLRGQAAVELGWLAASLAQQQCHSKLIDGWRLIVKELGDEADNRLIADYLTKALSSVKPSANLYDRAREAAGEQAETIMYLSAAYDWSQVILALLAGDDSESTAVWDRLHEFFNIEHSPEKLAEIQSSLAVRLYWKENGLPFETLARLHHQTGWRMQRIVYDFSNHIGRWQQWLEWQHDYLK